MRERKRMTGRWLLIVVLCFGPSVADAACSGSSPTWTAASVSRTDVSDCITAASSGDTINVPAGTDTTTWTTSVVLPAGKNLTISGAGSSSTILTCTSTCFTIRNSTITDLSGFELKNASGSSGSYLLLVRPDKPATGKYFIVHHNKFTKTGGGYASVDVFGDVDTNCNDSTIIHPSGLFHHNTFTDARVDMNGTACSWGDGTAQHLLWTQTPPMGSWPEIVYSEDNSYVAGTGMINMFDSNYGGRYVSRYNTISGVSGASGYHEVHGIQGLNRAVQWKEVYRNTYTIPAGAYFGLMYMRSGSGVIWGNTVSTDAQIMRLNNERSYSAPGGAPQCDGASNWDGNQTGNGWPCRDQIGRMKDNSMWTNSGEAYSQDLMPAYFWKNYYTGGTTMIPRRREYRSTSTTSARTSGCIALIRPRRTRNASPRRRNSRPTMRRGWMRRRRPEWPTSSSWCWRNICASSSM